MTQAKLGQKLYALFEAHYGQINQEQSIKEMIEQLIDLTPEERSNVILHALIHSEHQFTWSFMARRFGVPMQDALIDRALKIIFQLPQGRFIDNQTLLEETNNAAKDEQNRPALDEVTLFSELKKRALTKNDILLVVPDGTPFVFGPAQTPENEYPGICPDIWFVGIPRL